MWVSYTWSKRGCGLSGASITDQEASGRFFAYVFLLRNSSPVIPTAVKIPLTYWKTEQMDSHTVLKSSVLSVLKERWVCLLRSDTPRDEKLMDRDSETKKLPRGYICILRRTSGNVLGFHDNILHTIDL